VNSEPVNSEPVNSEDVDPIPVGLELANLGSIGSDLIRYAETLESAPRTAESVLVVVASDLVVSPAAIAPVAADSLVGTALLVRPVVRDADVRVRHHVVNSVGTSFHQVTAPDHRFIGVAAVSGNDAPVVAPVLRELAAAVESGELGSGHRDASSLVAVAIVRSGAPCKAIDMVDVPWFRNPVDQARAQAEANSVSETRIAQLQANRLDDGFYSTFVVRRLSKPLTRAALRLGLSPNAVTLGSFAIGLGAAGAFALGYRWALVLGAVLLQLSLVVDCVDGEVARATRRFSALGAWLDASTDRVKEYLAYAGLAIGAAAVHGINIWPLALLMVVLQTTRHMTDYDFSRVQRRREALVLPRSIRLPDDGAAGAAGGWSVQGAMELSSRINRRDAVRWAKRAIHLPIGERWLIISLVAALLGARWALGVLLVAGLLAFGYVTAGRILRTLGWRGPAPHDAALLLARQSDAGPVAWLLARLVPQSLWVGMWSAPAAWAVPAALRFLELGIVTVIALAIYPSAMVVAFWWVTIIAFHHYDVLYRAIAGQAAPRWLTWAGLGWDGRTILVLVTALSGLVAFAGTMALGIVAWTVLLVFIASAQWLVASSRAGRGAQ
jgi:hypothetical protein